MIDNVNDFKSAEFTYASCSDKINKIMIEIKEDNICDDEIYEDPWLKLKELYNINQLIDISFGNIWNLSIDKDRKTETKINIDKYLKIDKSVDEYIDITEGKIDLFNNLGLIISKATDEIQNAVYIVNDLKRKENLDIKTLKAMHETLEKVITKWMKTISKTFENVSLVSMI